ncbi:MAG: 50S ribosomal protein L9 [Phycisphaera sp.]|nr:50S ribosomal protein L9 [Phycisphaera sp.]
MATKKSIKLLLTENVDSLGIVGDVVNVKPGYARNYLIPMGLADQPTQGNMKKVEERRKEVERQLRELREHQVKLIEQLEDFELTMKRAANEEGILYGSVSQHDIAEALIEEGFNLKEREIRIGDPIKRLDSYKIPIQLANDLKTEIKLWVVSDKPIEELDAAMEEDQQDDAEDAGGDDRE